MPTRPPSFRPPRLKGHEKKATNPLYLSRAFRAVREKVLIRDHYTCQICKRVVTGRNAHVDHIIEVAIGGDPLALWNLRCLCAVCNGRKGRQFQLSKG